jgi:WD40 repeat protein
LRRIAKESLMNRPALFAGLAVVGWSASALAIGPPPATPRTDLHGHPLPEGAVARIGDPTRRAIRARDFAFSHDGRLVARHRETGIDIRELATGRDVTPAHLAGLTGATLTFAPDGRHVVLETSRGRCRLLDPESGEVVFDLSLAGRHPWFAAVSRNGRSAVVRWYDGRGGAAFTLFDLAGSASPVGRDLLEGQQGFACLSPDGSLLVAATEIGARAFDTTTGKELPRPPLRHLAHVYGAALSPDGRTLAAAHADNLRLYPVSPEGIGEPAVLPPVDLRGGMAWTDDGRELVLACRDVIIRLDGKSGQSVGQSRREGSYGRGPMYLSPDGRLAADAGGPEPATVWDIRTGKEVYRYPDLVPLVHVACPDSRTAVTLGTGLQLDVWSLTDGRPIESRPLDVPRRGGWPTGRFSPDGRLLAVYDSWSQALQVCDVATGRLLRAAGGWAPVFPTGFGFAPDGGRLVVAAQGRVGLADWQSGRFLRELPGGGLSAGFSPDGRLVAVLDRDQVRIVEVATNKVRRVMTVPEVPLDGRDVRFTAGRVRFSRDSTRLAVFGSCFRVWVWNTADGELLFEDRGDRTNLYSDVRPGEISPDGRWLAYPSEDSSGVRVIDLSNPRPGSGVAHIRGHQSRVTDMAFTPDGVYLVTVCSDGTGLVWDMAAVTARLRPRSDEYPCAESLWEALADPDAEKAGVAIEALVRSSTSAVEVIADRLIPAAPADPAAVRKWVAELDSAVFSVRDRAERALAALRELAAPALEEAVKEPLSAEHRDRLERLLARVDGVEHDPERVRALRAVEVLERIGSPESRRVLESVAAGDPQARLTREASAALERLRAAGPGYAR